MKFVLKDRIDRTLRINNHFFTKTTQAKMLEEWLSLTGWVPISPGGDRPTLQEKLLNI